MKKSAMVLMVLTSLLIINSCKDSGTGPEKNDLEPNYEPGRRDYVWTADTIKAYYIFFNSIWGKNENDVWLVSLVGGTYENIYRYNGTTWYKETRASIGNPVSLWGSEKELWISSMDGYIWNFRDNIFTPSPHFKYEGEDIIFFSLAGKTDKEVYAGGGRGVNYNRDGVIYKFNGNDWQQSIEMKNMGNVFQTKYSSRNDRYYFLANIDNIETSDTTRFIEYDGNKIKTIINEPSVGNNLTMNVIDGYLYLKRSNKILRYYKGVFKEYLDIALPNFGGQIWGRNKNDFFIRMKDGLLHYNGTDLNYLIKLPSNTEFGADMLVLEKDVFFTAFDNNTGYNIIYHGQLK